MSRSLLAALVAAFLAIVPAAARAQDGPTLTFDKPCYAEGDPMAYSGAGFTPSGEVNFLFSTLSSSRVGSFDTQRGHRRRDRWDDRRRRTRRCSSTTTSGPP